MDRVWIVECHICDRFDWTHEPDGDDAEAELVELGWTADGEDQLCPDCRDSDPSPTTDRSAS